MWEPKWSVPGTVCQGSGELDHAAPASKFIYCVCSYIATLSGVQYQYHYFC